MKWNGKAVFKRLENKLQKARSEAPKILANAGQKVFLNNFQTQSWNGAQWKERKKDAGRPLLIGKTRRLRNSVANSIRFANINRIKWATNIPYAAVHNQGLEVTRKASQKIVHFRKGKFSKAKRATSAMKLNIGGGSFKMPKRQFMGDSFILRTELKNKMNQIFRSNLK